MYPFGFRVIGVAPRYIPVGAVIELAGIRLSSTSTPTGIRETQAGGNQIQGHLSSSGPDYQTDSGSQRLIPWWSRIAHLSVKVTRGLHQAPSLTNTFHGSCARGAGPGAAEAAAGLAGMRSEGRGNFD